jgi:hypothetical protein
MGEISPAQYSDHTSMSRLLAQSFAILGVEEFRSPLICPNCQSSDLKKLSLVHAHGLHESRGNITGLLLGSVDTLIFGKSRQTNQSRLSAMAAPPRTLPYVKPFFLWLVGFFPIMAFAGRGKPSWITDSVAVAYILLLLAYPLGALLYNHLVRPKKYKRWDRMFMCQRCGVVVEPHTGSQSIVHA